MIFSANATLGWASVQIFYQLWSDAKEVVEELNGYKSAMVALQTAEDIAPDDNTPTE